MLYILNAFSLSMLPPERLELGIMLRRLLREEAQAIVASAPEFISGVGHANTAQLYSEQLGVDVPASRINVTMNQGDVFLVGQHIGPRLPEGATVLPDGARIEWCQVTLM